MINLKFLLISFLISGFLLLIAIATHDIGAIGNAVILSAFIIITPQIVISYKKFREIKEMEEKFPSFLRDLTEAIKSGLPLSKAIQSVKNVNYGRLSKEVRKMANQISWGIPVEKVLRQFAERVKKSKQLPIAVDIIIETYRAGGDIASTLDSVAESLVMLQEAERERRMMLNQYVTIMYAVSLIFIGIVAGINRFLTPIFKVTAATTGSQITMINPCENCIPYVTPTTIPCFICHIYQTISKTLFSIPETSPSSYYISLFFVTAMVQALFAGLIIGVISEGSTAAGFKHSLILAALVFGSFSILIRLGIII